MFPTFTFKFLPQSFTLSFALTQEQIDFIWNVIYPNYLGDLDQDLDTLGDLAEELGFDFDMWEELNIAIRWA